MRLHELDAQALDRLYREKSVSPVEVMQACLQRHHTTHHHINAVCHVDEAGALLAAHEAEARMLRSARLSVLDGVPFGKADVARAHALLVGFGSTPMDRATASRLAALSGETDAVRAVGRDVFWLRRTREPASDLVNGVFDRTAGQPLTFRTLDTIRKVERGRGGDARLRAKHGGQEHECGERELGGHTQMCSAHRPTSTTGGGLWWPRP